MLHQMVTKGEVDLGTVANKSNEELINICRTCKITSSGKSKVTSTSYIVWITFQSLFIYRKPLIPAACAS